MSRQFRNGAQVTVRGGASTIVLAIFLGMSVPQAAIAARAEEKARLFDVPASPLETALMNFAMQANVQLVMQSHDVAGLQAHPVSGRLEPEAALRTIVGGAPLQIRWTGPNTVMIRARSVEMRAVALQSAETAAPAAPEVAPPPPAAEPSPEQDIIVNARKRDETSIAVPVTISAVGRQELERRAITNLDNLSSIVPSLQIGAGGGAIQGGNIVIRGVSGSDSNPFADQAVSFNVDGVQVARAIVRRMATMDMQQVEVLKGPQALFFGKNSPGGVISIRTADPTPHFEARASLGYEFYAHEITGDGYISGPVTNSLGARLAFYASGMRGWENNDFNAGIYTPTDKHLPHSREYALRGTLKYDNGGPFNARFKLTYNHLRDAGALTSEERVDCPLGTPQGGGGPDDCTPNGHMFRIDPGPNVARFDPRFGDGSPFLRQYQLLGSLELNYHLADHLTLTSVTGYYRTSSHVADDFSLAFNPAAGLANRNDLTFREIGEELRLASNYDGPVNFLTGAYFQDSKASVRVDTVSNFVNPILVNNYALQQHGTSYSVFGQVMVKPIDVIEISAGGRYSYEKKRLPLVASSPIVGNPVPLPINPLYPRKDSWNNLSPEFTISYRPTSRLTVFGSYKEGFLSGGFNSGATNLNSDLRYNQQTIHGFEGGIKASLFGGALRANISAYRYSIEGMQVTTNFQSGAIIVQQVTNAGHVTIRGVEGDFNYRTPLSGLTLHGAFAYNDGTYDKFTVACYRGQTQADGCNAGLPNSAGLYSLQNLGGARLVRAPKWTGTVGIGYETDIGNNLRGSISLDGTYSSAFYTDATESPGSVQRHYALLDLTAQFGARDDRWAVAVIGRNLTNKYYFTRSVDMPATGTVPGGIAGTRADTIGYVARGRQVMVRFTIKYGR